MKLQSIDMSLRESAESDRIDIPALFLAFRRRLGLFLAAFLTILCLTIVVTLQATPLFTSTASVIIDPQQREVTDFESVLSGQAPDSALVDTEVEIIRSRALIERVVAKLDLVQDPEFNRDLKTYEGLAAVKQNARTWVDSLLPSQVSTVNSVEITERLTRENVVNELLKNLNVRREGKTYVIKISYTSEGAQKAAQIANAVADQYLVEQLEAKFETTSRSSSWLSDRLEGLRQDVRSSENAVELYRAQSGLLSAQGSSLTEQQISDLNAQLIIQRAGFDEANARLTSVRSQVERGAGAETIGEVLSSEVIRDLRKQQSEVAGRRAELSSRYGARHPEIMKVEREAADVASQIEQEVKRIVSSLESEVGIARQKVSSIETGLGSLRGELSSNNRSLVRLRELERDANATRTLYESFLGRFKETGEQESLAEADARIVSAAALPVEKSSPNTLLNILLGLVLGTAIGAALVALMEMLDNGLSTGMQVEKATGLPFIASVPQIGAALMNSVKKLTGGRTLPHDYIVEKPLSSFAESYRTLRSSILLSDVDRAPQMVTITSALPGDGKTSTSYSLGRLSAMSGAKTLVIDCDLRRRNLSQLLPKEPKQGMLQCLAGEVALSDIIIKDDKTDCDILPLSQTQYTPKDIFGSEAFKKLIGELRETYELIVLDTAPVLPVAETRTLANMSDAVVLTVKWRRTKKDALVTATKILNESGARIIGVLLTQVNLRARGKYGYGDYGYYYKSYRKYYAD